MAKLIVNTEFDVDTKQNQIIKATLTKLVSVDSLEKT